MILDTNAISALQGGEAGLVALLADEPVLVLNVVSLGEYRYGVDGSRHRNVLERWLEALIARSEVLAPNLETLPHYSGIRHALRQAGTPIPANDVWIAALALQHGRSVLSMDAQFDLVPRLKRVAW